MSELSRHAHKKGGNGKEKGHGGVLNGAARFALLNAKPRIRDAGLRFFCLEITES